MDLEKTVKEINKDREKVEACFVFCLWNDPEQYCDYLKINDGKQKTLINKDAKFYFSLGKAMYEQGYRNFDNVTCETFLDHKPEIRKKFDEYGGYHEIEQLKNLVSTDNTEAYYDKICKMNTLISMANKYDDIFSNVKRFDDATNEEVYNAFEFLNNSIALSTNEKIENLVIDDRFVQGLIDGDNMGFNYGKYSPLLNYITLGAAPGLYMAAGHSGIGKSSFVFGSMLMSLHHAGHKTAIISNEMGIQTYKVLLLSHILTQDMKYYGLTRKQIRMGKWNEEQREKIEEAMSISNDKYSDIMFVKLYGNDIKKVTKYLKKLKGLGVDVCLFDTFKSDDNADSGMLWQSLLLDSRRIDNVCRQLDICCVTTYQLALHTLNQRYLDATCLSNAKQVKEVYETMVYFRVLWDDEYTGEKYDVKPWKYKMGNNKIKEEIQLDKNKKYLLAFVDKTRSDDDKQILIYEWLPQYNIWKELGFAHVINEHRNF